MKIILSDWNIERWREEGSAGKLCSGREGRKYHLDCNCLLNAVHDRECVLGVVCWGKNGDESWRLSSLSLQSATENYYRWGSGRILHILHWFWCSVYVLHPARCEELCSWESDLIHQLCLSVSMCKSGERLKKNHTTTNKTKTKRPPTTFQFAFSHRFRLVEGKAGWTSSGVVWE